jgi:hypothetical protein
MMKMLETQVGQLLGHPMGNKEEFSRQPQGPETTKATQTHSGEMEDHTKETMKIMTEGPEFEMLSHYMKEVVASVKIKGQSQPVKDNSWLNILFGSKTLYMSHPMSYSFRETKTKIKI